MMKSAIRAQIALATLKSHAQLFLGAIHRSFCNPLDFATGLT